MLGTMQNTSHVVLKVFFGGGVGLNFAICQREDPYLANRSRGGMPSFHQILIIKK